MKKLLYVALMALTVGLMASCAGKSGGSDYYKDGKTPVIDEKNCTVNGTKYDNEKEKCWKVIVKGTGRFDFGFAMVDLKQDQSEEGYVWGTQFEMVAGCETLMYTAAKTGTKASYSFSEASAYKDSESCLKNNNEKEE